MPKLRRASSEENKNKVDEQENIEQGQHVGLVLRARRREMDMSQALLAKKMQTSQEVISNYENGVTPVRADDLPRFAGVLEVTPLYFFEPNYQNRVGALPSQAPVSQGSNSQPLDTQPPAAPRTISWFHPQAADPDEQAESQQAGSQQAEHSKTALSTLPEADREEALLAYYRTLSGRMQTLAVKLIRELAQDEQEPQSRVVVWKPKP
jgi:transcriptional regulator with XRE-family HTH domain